VEENFSHDLNAFKMKFGAYGYILACMFWLFHERFVDIVVIKIFVKVEIRGARHQVADAARVSLRHGGSRIRPTSQLASMLRESTIGIEKFRLRALRIKL
jgi:hypothetical protein